LCLIARRFAFRRSLVLVLAGFALPGRLLLPRPGFLRFFALLLPAGATTAAAVARLVVPTRLAAAATALGGLAGARLLFLDGRVFASEEKTQQAGQQAGLLWLGAHNRYGGGA